MLQSLQLALSFLYVLLATGLTFAAEPPIPFVLRAALATAQAPLAALQPTNAVSVTAPPATSTIDSTLDLHARATTLTYSDGYDRCHAQQVACTAGFGCCPAGHRCAFTSADGTASIGICKGGGCAPGVASCTAPLAACCPEPGLTCGSDGTCSAPAGAARTGGAGPGAGEGGGSGQGVGAGKGGGNGQGAGTGQGSGGGSHGPGKNAKGGNGSGSSAGRALTRLGAKTGISVLVLLAFVTGAAMVML